MSIKPALTQCDDKILGKLNDDPYSIKAICNQSQIQEPATAAINCNGVIRKFVLYLWSDVRDGGEDATVHFFISKSSSPKIDDVDHSSPGNQQRSF